MPIFDLCSKDLVLIEKGASLLRAAQLMKKHHVGSVIVVESKGKSKPVGILTDRDIVLGGVAESLPLSTKVMDLMSSEIIKVSKKKGIAEVIEKMESKGIRRMIVVDDEDNACGLVSYDDVLRLIFQELNSLGKLVEREQNNEKNHRPTKNELRI